MVFSIAVMMLRVMFDCTVCDFVQVTDEQASSLKVKVIHHTPLHFAANDYR